MRRKIDAILVEEWRKLEVNYLSSGYSRYVAHEKIGERFGFSYMTIYRRLTPGYFWL